ncbi:MAG: apolipoprotein A1/A4/E family protein [Bacteroidales bacterium]|nr:apolipoprotein A1/A4/E family protein [Bacteroidales bacterium]
MNTLVEFLKNFLLSPVGTFSTIASVLSIAAWLIVIATRKVTRLELSQKQLETGHKEVVKKIDQLSADMRDGFQRMDERFQKVDEKFESLEQKMDERFQKVDEKIENLEQRMDEKFERLEQKMDKRIVKMDEKFDRKIESLSEKMDRNTEELRKDIANLRTDVRILQHDNHNAKSPASRTKSFRQGNRRRVAAGF